MDVERRLQLLESEIRRMRRWNLGLAFVLVAVVGVAAGPRLKTPKLSVPDDSQSPQKETTPPEAADQQAPSGRNRLRTVEADQFVLLDREGRSRMIMVVDQLGPALGLFDEQGRKRLELRQSRDVAGINLLDENQLTVASLQVHREAESTQLALSGSNGTTLIRSSGVTIQDRDEQSRLMFGLINGNRPSLGISQSGQQGSPSVEITSGDDGSRQVALHDAEGHPLLSLHTAKDGSSFMSMRHRQHERSLQVSLGKSDTNGPRIDFFTPANPDGSGGILPALQLGIRQDQQPYIRMVDHAGMPVFTAPAK